MQVTVVNAIFVIECNTTGVCSSVSRFFSVLDILVSANILKYAGELAWLKYVWKNESWKIVPQYRLCRSGGHR